MLTITSSRKGKPEDALNNFTLIEKIQFSVTLNANFHYLLFRKTYSEDFEKRNIEKEFSNISQMKKFLDLSVAF